MFSDCLRDGAAVAGIGVQTRNCRVTPNVCHDRPLCKATLRELEVLHEVLAVLAVLASKRETAHVFNMSHKSTYARVGCGRRYWRANEKLQSDKALIEDKLRKMAVVPGIGMPRLVPSLPPAPLNTLDDKP